MKVMKGLIKFLIIGLVLVLLAGLAAWYYLRPAEQLDLHYETISVMDKLTETIKNRKLELSFNESEMNHIIKKNLEPHVNDHIHIKGAHFTLLDKKIKALLHIRYYDLADAEITVEYAVKWQDPVLVLTPTSLSAKALPLPLDWVKEIEAPIPLPAEDLIEIKAIQLTPQQMTFQFGLRKLDWF